MSKAVVEALKEFIRTLVLGMIPVLVGALAIVKLGIDVEVGGFSIRWILVLAVLASGFVSVVQTALMSAGDKWLHSNDIKTILDLKSMDSLKKP